ncbi:Dynein heavy chain 1, axonemal [Borealophlyctis nickersoniae]|nr:Dynein heavy chain 1, axonemal [Borealophlyctis nickersoniae]
MAAGTLPKTLVLAVYACAAPFSEHPELMTDPVNRWAAGESFYMESRKGIAEEKERPTLEGVQACMLLGQYSMGCGKVSAGWMFLSMAVLMAIDLKLNEDPNIDDPYGGPCWILNETKRRTYWCTILLDRMLAAWADRRPISVADDLNKVAFPCNEHIWITVSNIQDGSPQSRSLAPRHRTYFIDRLDETDMGWKNPIAYKILIARMFPSVLELLQSRDTTKPDLTPDFLRRAHTMIAEVDAFVASWPSWIRLPVGFDPAAFPPSLPADTTGALWPYLNDVEWINVFWRAGKLILLRPILISEMHLRGPDARHTNTFKTSVRLAEDCGNVMQRCIARLYGTDDTPPKTLKTLDADSPLITRGLNALRRVTRHAAPDVTALIDAYRKYEFLLAPVPEFTTLDVDALTNSLAVYTAAYKDVPSVSLDTVTIPPLIIDCRAVKKTFLSRAQTTLGVLREAVVGRLLETCRVLSEAFKGLHGRVTADPGNDAARWRALKRAAATCSEEAGGYEAQFGELRGLWQMLHGYEMNLDDEANEVYWSTCTWPSKLENELQYATERLEGSRTRILAQLEIDRDYLTSSVAAYAEEIETFQNIDNTDKADDMATRVHALGERLARLEDLARSLQQTEEIMGIPRTFVDALPHLLSEFQKYKTLWVLASTQRRHLAEWMDAYFVDLNAESMIASISEWRQTASSLSTAFPDDTAHTKPRTVLARLKRDVDTFSRFMRVITCLRNPALKDTHWQDIQKVVGLSFHDIAGLKLHQVLALDLELIQDIVAAVSQDATNEYRLETQLDAMRAELASRDFAVVAYYDFLFVGNRDEVAEICSDQLVRCDRMMESVATHHGAVGAKIDAWMKKLYRAQEILEGWERLQKGFRRLYPVFKIANETEWTGRDDAEGFLSLVKTMTILSDIIDKNRKFITILLRSDMYDMINFANIRSESIIRNLTNLINHKRDVFSPFYFLSDDEILDLIECSWDIRECSRHLTKIFDGVEGLIVGEEAADVGAGGVGKGDQRRQSNALPVRKVIQGVCAFDGEQVTLSQSVLCTKRIEDWMLSLDAKLKDTLSKAIEAAVASGQFFSSKWLDTYPMQACIVAANIAWTRGGGSVSPAAEKDSDPVAAKEHRRALTTHLHELCAQVQAPKPSSLRSRIETMITWLLYLLDGSRGEVLDHVPQYTAEKEKDAFTVRMYLGSNHLPYGFEYIGSTSRLVLAPSTSRCMTQMMHIMRHGGSASVTGPPGCGKSQTVADFARLLGRRCFVYHCSAAVDRAHLTRVFVGMLKGRWVCLKELDRVKPALLSVLGQDVGAFQRCLLMASKAKRHMYTFNGREFAVSPHSAIFATYTHEWRRIPISVKALFRPVALAFPDAAYLIQSLLTAKGFANAESLARKISFLLNAVGWGSQPGKIWTIIAAADHLKTAPSARNPSEDVLLCRAVRSIVEPELAADELPVFLTKLKDTFRDDGRITAHNNSVLSNALRDVGEASRLSISDYFVDKAIQLFESLETHQTVIVVGEPMAGKTSCWQLLGKVVTARIFRCFPEAAGKLESFVAANGLVVPGVLSQAFQQAVSYAHERAPDAQERTAGIAWIVLDGIRDYNAVIGLSGDAPQVARIGTSEIHHLPKPLRLIFETESLQTACPGMVSKSRVVCMSSDKITNSMVFEAGLRSFPANVAPFFNFLRDAYAMIVEPMITFALRTCKPHLITVGLVLTKHLHQVMACMFEDFGTGGLERLTSEEQYIWILANLLLASFHVVGAFHDVASRLKFDVFVKTHIMDRCLADLEAKSETSLQTVSTIPAAGTVYDYYFDGKLLRWRRWTSMESPRPPPDVVPTADYVRICHFSELLKGRSLIITGKAGTGKSTIAYSAVSSKRGAAATVPSIFCGSVPADVFRQQTEALLVKKRRGALGLTRGQRKHILVDDLHVRTAETSQHQRLFELWRVWFAMGGWYTGDDATTFHSIEDISIVGVLEQPVVNLMPLRCLQHLLILCLDDDIEGKVREISKEWVEKSFQRLNGPYADKFGSLVLDGTISLYKKVTAGFPPSPKTPHYLFSMRDIREVINAAVIQVEVETFTTALVHLWGHACTRAFRDPLSDKSDLDMFDSLFGDVLLQTFGLGIKEVFLENDPLLYGPRNSQNAGPPKRITSPSEVINATQRVTEEAQKHAAVLHPDGVTMALKVYDKISKPGGHAVLCGTNYGDRFSIGRYAASLADVAFLECRDQVAWSTVLDSICSQVAEADQAIAVMVEESALSPAQWDELAIFMKWGVPPLTITADVAKNFSSRLESEGYGNEADMPFLLWHHMQKSVRLILAFERPPHSEPREHYRNWINVRPDIACICSWKWMNLWSETTVAVTVEAAISNSQDYYALSQQLNAINSFFGKVFSSLDMIADRQRRYDRRRIRVPFSDNRTAARCFVTFFDKAHSAASERVDRFKKGLNKLKVIYVSIEQVRVDFENRRTSHEDAVEQTREFLKEMEDERERTDKVSKDVRRNSESLNKFKEEHKQLNELYLSELGTVVPTLNAAQKAVENLHKADIYDLKSMINPPQGMRMVMEAVLTLFKFESKPAEGTWEATRRFLSEVKFSSFDRESVTVPMILKTESYTKSPDFNPRELSKLSKAASALASWVLALQKYHNITLALQPRKRQIHELEVKIEEMTADLQKSKAHLAVLEGKLAEMRNEFDTVIKRKESMFVQFKEAERKYVASQELLVAVKSMEERWLLKLDELRRKKTYVLGHALLAGCTVAFLGPCSGPVRSAVLAQWVEYLTEENVPLHDNVVPFQFSLSDFMTEGGAEEYLMTYSLPLDKIAMDNLFISRWHSKFPLIYDPHERFEIWVKTLERERLGECFKQSDPDFVERFAQVAKRGVPLILVIDDEEIHEAVRTLLAERHFCTDLQNLKVTIGSEIVQVAPSFHMYFITHKPISNAIWTRYLSYVHFPMSEDAVTEDINSLLLSICDNQLKQHSRQFDIDNFNRSNRLTQLDKRGLDFVDHLDPNDAVGDRDLLRSLLDNEEQLSNTLKQAQSISQIGKDLQTHLKWYRTVSTSAASFWNIVAGMEKVDTAYAAQLPRFLETCQEVLRDVAENDLAGLNHARRAMVRQLKVSVLPGLSRADALLCAFLLSAELWRQTVGDGDHLVLPSHWYFLINGKPDPTVKISRKPHIDESPSNPSPWLHRRRWERILQLSKVPEFSKLAIEFVSYANRSTTPVAEQSFEDTFRSVRPWNSSLPIRWDSKSRFEKLLITSSLRPDSLSGAMHAYVSGVMGEGFLETRDVIEQHFTMSAPLVPIVILTSKDPLPHIRKFAVKKNHINFMSVLPLGEGEDVVASADTAFADAAVKGRWLVLLNCHLLPDYMKKLDRKLTALAAVDPKLSSVNPNFRLWLTANLSPEFPTRLFRRSLSIRVDYPHDAKWVLTNILSCLEENIAPHEFKGSVSYRNFLMRTTTFHAYISAREGFGPARFMTSYEFSLSDLSQLVKIIRELYTSADVGVNEKALAKKMFHLVGDVTYGIHVPLDQWEDRRLLASLFTDFMSLEWASSEEEVAMTVPALKPTYDAMQKNDMEAMYETIWSIPRDQMGETTTLGLSENMEVHRNQVTSNQIVKSIGKYSAELVVEIPRDVWEAYDIVKQKVEEILERIGKVVDGSVFDTSIPAQDSPPPSGGLRAHGKHMDMLYHNNMKQYSTLLNTLQTTLHTLHAQLEGHDLLDTWGYRFAEQLHEQTLPDAWTKSGTCYPSRMRVARWIDNFIDRITFIKEWHQIRFGDHAGALRVPIILDITKLFEPAELFQAVLFDHAIANRESVETLEMDTMVVSSKQTTPPERGCYISGLSLLGAAWDNTHNQLKECKPYEHHTSMPCIWLQPVVKYDSISSSTATPGAASKQQSSTSGMKRSWQKYKCPIYIYKPNSSVEEYSSDDRAPRDLFVGTVDFATDQQVKVWIKKSVSLVCELPQM